MARTGSVSSGTILGYTRSGRVKYTEAWSKAVYMGNMGMTYKERGGRMGAPRT